MVSYPTIVTFLLLLFPSFYQNNMTWCISPRECEIIISSFIYFFSFFLILRNTNEKKKKNMKIKTKKYEATTRVYSRTGHLFSQDLAIIIRLRFSVSHRWNIRIVLGHHGCANPHMPKIGWWSCSVCTSYIPHYPPSGIWLSAGG